MYLLQDLSTYEETLCNILGDRVLKNLFPKQLIQYIMLMVINGKELRKVKGEKK